VSRELVHRVPREQTPEVVHAFGVASGRGQRLTARQQQVAIELLRILAPREVPLAGALVLEYVALRWMYRKAMLCGLPIIEANIDDSFVRPETPIKPNPLSRVSKYWRGIDETDLVHDTIAPHKEIAGEDVNRVPAGGPTKTAEDERTRIVPPAVAAN
jgi:hypothetical protein